MDVLQRIDDGDTGVKELKIDSAIKFSHPLIADDVNIPSGANAIKWHYTLNTVVTPTIGGEVTQILSAYVGPMMVEGLATSNIEMKRIKNWFEAYFEIAGTAYRDDISFRNERAVTFSYPARGWSFYIDPTQFDGWRFDKATYAVPWTMTAEIVSDNALNYLSGVTMTSFTGPLANPAFVQVGFSDPTGTGKASMFVNPLLSADIPALANTMGDNFQRLIASFATGDFKNFAFGYTKDFQLAGLPKDINAEYTKAYGSPYIVGGTNNTTGGGSGSGTITYGSIITNPHTQAQVVQDIAIIADGHNVPAQLAVTIAIHESALNPDAVQGTTYGNKTVSGDGAVGLFQTFYHSLANGGAGRGAGTPHAAEIKQAMAPLKLGQPLPGGYSVTKYYPAVDQIKDAVGWISQYAPTHPDPTDVTQMAQWAARAQGGVGYTNDNTGTGSPTQLFKKDWAQAATYLQAVNYSSNTILQTLRSQLGVKESPSGSNSGPEVNQYLASVGLGPGNAWCAAFVYWVFQKVLGNQNPLTKTGLVLTQFNYGKKQGWQKSISAAQPGDLAIFNWTGSITTDPSPYHIGIVTRIVNNKPWMISGNYGDSVSDEGPTDLVAILRPPLSPSVIGN